MGIGYGSEWHLLRMLGHHRNYFFDKLKEALSLESDSEIDWPDYPTSDTRVSGDSEYVRLAFMKFFPDIYPKIKMKEIGDAEFCKKIRWHWDGVFRVGKTIYMVEAKARVSELKNDCTATDEKSIVEIKADLKETKEYFKIQSENDWVKGNYQLANRLAFVALMEKYDIDAKLVYVYFINGYDKKETNESVTREGWNDATKIERAEMGLNEETDKVMYSVFIDCKKEE